ncbi:hypothetical protein [Streptomyces bacillaris]|uniref:hypothetical protein n=1 Tax=Streptomyces bacillaris TaxID=68179 RepID=UPI00363BEFA5
MRKVWLSVVAAAVAAAALTACTSNEGPVRGDAAAGAEKAPAAEASADVTIVGSGVEDHETWGEKAYVVQYEITNGGQQAANYFAQLEFLDSDGDVLGSTGVTAEKLGVGKTHRGDIAPLPAEITNGQIADIQTVRVSEVDRSAAS